MFQALGRGGGWGGGGGVGVYPVIRPVFDGRIKRRNCRQMGQKGKTNPGFFCRFFPTESTKKILGKEENVMNDHTFDNGKILLPGKGLTLFPNKPWFLRVCSISLLNTMWEKEKLLVTSNFSFSHSVFYPF